MQSVRNLVILIQFLFMVGCSEPKQPVPPTAEEQAQGDREAKAADDAERAQNQQTSAKPKKK